MPDVIGSKIHSEAGREDTLYNWNQSGNLRNYIGIIANILRFSKSSCKPKRSSKIFSKRGYFFRHSFKNIPRQLFIVFLIAFAWHKTYIYCVKNNRKYYFTVPVE